LTAFFTAVARWDNGPWANSFKDGLCRTVAELNLWQGWQMACQQELSARAALCKQLAKREPTNRVLWTAEAEFWSRLSKEKIRDEQEIRQENSWSGTRDQMNARSRCYSVQMGPTTNMASAPVALQTYANVLEFH
jgi:hypothetical protein